MPRRAAPFRVDLVIEFAAVLQPGQRVGGRELLELFLGLGAAADLARQKQRRAEHEQDERAQDAADPDRLRVPKAEDAVQRLSDDDEERTVPLRRTYSRGVGSTGPTPA